MAGRPQQYVPGPQGPITAKKTHLGVAIAEGVRGVERRGVGVKDQGRRKPDMEKAHGPEAGSADKVIKGKGLQLATTLYFRVVY